MRATTILSPRGKRTKWRVNCYDTGKLVTSVDVTDYQIATEASSAWKSDATCQSLKETYAKA